MLMLYDAQLVTIHAWQRWHLTLFLPVFSPAVGLATGSQHDLCAAVTQPVGTNMRCLIKQRCTCLKPNSELRVTDQSRKKHITSPINLQSRLLHDQ